jgi:hypothetical protein
MISRLAGTMAATVALRHLVSWRICNLARAMCSARPTVVSIAALALATALALGCRAVNNGSSEGAGGESSPSISGLDGSASEAADGPSLPAANEMSVFARPRTDADVLPSELSHRQSPEEPCTDWQRANIGCLGDPIGDESRLLISPPGVTKANLYAWPTTNGSVCWGWDGGAGGCAHDFARGDSRAIFMGIDPDEEGVGAPGTLLGVVPDDVVAVDVQVRGERHAAIVQGNGFFYELPDGSCTNWAFESFTVTYRDGSTDTVPIEWHEAQEGLPETCRG